MKLGAGHAYRRDQRARELYTAIEKFGAAHTGAGAGDARLHAWCQPPERWAPRDVTIFSNALLDYCGKTETRLGGVRAV